MGEQDGYNEAKVMFTMKLVSQHCALTCTLHSNALYTQLHCALRCIVYPNAFRRPHKTRMQGLVQHLH